jgi:hypothetical protein
LALGANGDFAVVTDADARLLAPDKRPPRTGRHGTQDGAFFIEGLLPGGVRGGAEFPVDFVLIDMGQELVKQAVGTFEFQNAVSGQQCGKAFLPVVVLPERAQITDLPAFDGFGRGLVTGVRCQVVLDGPAADAGAVGFEI